MIHSFVITGFLGVGKSTMLINTVQKYFEDKQVAIIVNEFGDIGIDGKILKNVHSEVLEISEGCICCQLAEEFESGVLEIMSSYNPDIILVETSGASEPFPIYLSLRNLGINIEGVICIVDAKNFDSYKENSTAKYQLGGSNILVINKIDLVNDEELSEVNKQVIAIKEKYNIKSKFTGETIFNNYVIHHAEKGLVPKEVFEGTYNLNEIIGLAGDYQHIDHTSKDSISQKVAILKQDIEFSAIDNLLNSLPKNIYRVKGVVLTKDIPNPVIINYSFGDTSFEELQDYKDQSILIFIGESISHDVTLLAEKFDFLRIPDNHHH